MAKTGKFSHKTRTIKRNCAPLKINADALLAIDGWSTAMRWKPSKHSKQRVKPK